MKRVLGCAAALALLLGGGMAAEGFILDTTLVKGSAKWRTNTFKATSKYSQCVAGAVAKCEKKSGTAEIECFVNVEPANVVGNSDCIAAGNPATCCTGAGTGNCHPDAASAESDLQTKLADCASKVDLAKGAFDFDRDGTAGDAGDFPALGCNVDCIAGSSGVGVAGPQADAASCPAATATWKSAVIAPNGTARNAVSALGGFIGIACSGAAPPVGGLGTCVSGACTSDGRSCTGDEDCPESIKCFDVGVKNVLKLLKGYQGCEQKCEDDVKDKKGNGGIDDSDRCGLTGGALSSPTPDANMAACQTKVDSGVDLAHPSVAALRPLLIDVLNAANDDAYNQLDPTTKASPNPNLAPACGFCGDGMRDPWEECDGAANALCVTPAMGAACLAADNAVTGEDACECAAGLL